MATVFDALRLFGGSSALRRGAAVKRQAKSRPVTPPSHVNGDTRLTNMPKNAKAARRPVRAGGATVYPKARAVRDAPFILPAPPVLIAPSVLTSVSRAPSARPVPRASPALPVPSRLSAVSADGGAARRFNRRERADNAAARRAGETPARSAAARRIQTEPITRAAALPQQASGGIQRGVHVLRSGTGTVSERRRAGETPARPAVARRVLTETPSITNSAAPSQRESGGIPPAAPVFRSENAAAGRSEYPIDYDRVLYHIEQRLSEAISCCAEGL